MGAAFNEKLIELEYFHLWKRAFMPKGKKILQAVFCPGKEEVHVGFDLGFAVSKQKFKFSDDQFFDWIKSKVRNPKLKNNAFISASFFQYKLLEKILNLGRIKDKNTSNYLIKTMSFPTKPGFRAKLDTVPNKLKSGLSRPISQHQALCRLARIKNVQVAYCLPNFSAPPISPPHRISLSNLFLIKVEASTPVLRDSLPHYLYFRNNLGRQPIWCSTPTNATLVDPVVPELISPLQFLRLMKANYLMDDGEGLVDLDQQQISEEDLLRKTFKQYLRHLPECTNLAIYGMY